MIDDTPSDYTGNILLLDESVLKNIKRNNQMMCSQSRSLQQSLLHAHQRIIPFYFFCDRIVKLKNITCMLILKNANQLRNKVE